MGVEWGGRGRRAGGKSWLLLWVLNLVPETTRVSLPIPGWHETSLRVSWPRGVKIQHQQERQEANRKLTNSRPRVVQKTKKTKKSAMHFSDHKCY